MKPSKPSQFAVFRERRPPVLVVSHERSGTHFLMNSIARGYGYTARPWVHPADFFDGILNRVLKRYVVFYIHRDPVEVMLSFWRFMHRWHWHEGPRCPDPLAFASAEPEGQLLRYQRYQYRNMLDRWAKHVEGWQRASVGRPRLRLVSYSALRDDYRPTLGGFSELLGRKPADLTPRARDESVIRGGKVNHQPDLPALRALALAEVGETMWLLGHS